MFLQLDITGFEWIIGLGLMFGVAFIITILVNPNYLTFFMSLTIMNAFMVWAEVLELWTLILLLIVDGALIFLKFRQTTYGGS